MDALEFTTKFRNSISKTHLCLPHLYGSVAMPCLAETTHIPVSEPPHHSKDKCGKYLPSNTEKWRSSSSPAPRELELSPALLERTGWRI